MSRILLVDDDENQVQVRRLIFEQHGYEAAVAHTPVHARRVFDLMQPDLVVLDLRLPELEDGLSLVREWQGRARVIVLSGAAEQMEGREELALVEQVLRKPIASRALLAAVARVLAVLLICVGVMRAEEMRFTLAKAGEAVAQLDLKAPTADWAVEGREAAVADVSLDGKKPFQVMVHGAAPSYPVFLGALAAGEHTLTITRNEKFSAAGVQLVIGKTKVETVSGDLAEVIAHAPVLFARKNTIGKFTDIPLVAYAERQGNLLTYTVIFSNEDGGTRTHALMARWGRTTDIEYVYSVDLTNGKGIVQGRGHKDLPYEGKFEGQHPYLIPVTDNNMVSGEAESEIRYQIAPALVDLSKHSREWVMDQNSWTYAIGAKELRRELKLREYGAVSGSKISDPRNYLILEFQSQNTNGAVYAMVRLEGNSTWYGSWLGFDEMAIERSGWMRSTIELPTDTPAAKIAEIGFGCVIARSDSKPLPQVGTCEVQSVGGVIQLTPDYRPVRVEGKWLTEPVTIRTGDVLAIPRTGIVKGPVRNR